MSADPADILRLLPNADLSRGPFGLLGLGPSRCDDFALVQALQRQLRRLEDSPERGTKEAAAVRDELYQAVAQLRDPETRERLGRRYFREAWVPAPVVASEPSAIAVPQTEPVAAERIVGDPTLSAPAWAEGAPRRAGGFNAGKAAAILLLGSAAMLVILGWLIVQTPPAVRPAPAPPRGGASAGAPGVAAGSAAGTAAGGEAASVVAAGGVPDPSATEAPPGEAISAGPVEAASARLSADDARGLLDALRQACGVEGTAAEVLAGFESALAPFEQRWAEMPGSLYAPASLAVAERLWRSARAEAKQGVAAYRRIEKPLDVLGESAVYLAPDAVAAAVWSGGMLGRVKGDSAVPGRLVSSARAKLASLTTDGEVPREHTFAAGAGVVLDALARRWARHGEGSTEEQARRAWSAWSRCAAAIGEAEAGATEAVVGGAVETLLRNGDAEGSPVIREALAVVLGTVRDWRAPEAGRRLLAWFDNPRVRPSALRVVTEWMASRGPVADIGPNMVLEAGATSLQRRALREAYAVRLGLAGDEGSGGRGASALVSAWAGAARAALAVKPGEVAAGSGEAALIDAVVAAGLNETAARLWAMDDDGAAAALEASSRGSVEASLGAAAPASKRFDPVVLTAPGASPDGEWARKMLAFSNNEAGRVLLLNQMRNGLGPAGPVDADVLAEVACYGSPATVRQLAQQAVKEFADRPEVVNAVLEAIPDASRQQSVSDMVAALTGASLPAPSDANWRARCRRALLEKLMRLSADESDQRADLLAARLAQACEGAAAAMVPAPASRDAGAGAGAGAGVGIGSAAAGGAPVVEAAERLRERWRDLARAMPEGSWAWLTFDELERRHGARVSLARGPIDAYLTQRVGGVEMMAQVVAGERSSQAGGPRSVTVDLASDLRTAATVLHQVRSVELAALRLWMIRFGEPLSTP